jgi:putative ABC transport system substrate-binding protein
LARRSIAEWLFVNELIEQMERRAFIGTFGIGVLACARVANAQQTGKVWRIGFLSNGARPPDGAPPALRQALQALGYAEGKDIVYEGRWGEARSERLPALAAELVALKVDLFVTNGAPAATAAKQATSMIPVIAVFAGDAVETGLVASLARPGGHVTGVNDPAAVLSAKRLEILKEVLPASKRIAVLWNAGDNAMTLRYRQIEKAAEMLRISIEPLGVREPDDFDVALAAMSRARPDALMMVSDALTGLNRQRVVDYAATHQIPAIYEFASVVKAGGLMSYGTDPGENFRLAADYVAKVLKGAKPGELPVEQPNRYLLVINLKTAKALGLTIPQSLLLRTDELIQ